MRGFFGGRFVLQLTFIHEQHVVIALHLTFEHIPAFSGIQIPKHGAVGAEHIPSELLLLVTVPVIVACFEVSSKVFVAGSRQIPSPERVVFVVWIIEVAAINGSVASKIFGKEICCTCKVVGIRLPILHASPIHVAHCV